MRQIDLIKKLFAEIWKILIVLGAFSTVILLIYAYHVYSPCSYRGQWYFEGRGITLDQPDDNCLTECYSYYAGCNEDWVAQSCPIRCTQFQCEPFAEATQGYFNAACMV